VHNQSNKALYIGRNIPPPHFRQLVNVRALSLLVVNVSISFLGRNFSLKGKTPPRMISFPPKQSDSNMR